MAIPNSKSEAGKRRLPLNPDALLAYGILLDRATQLGIAGPEFYVFPACEIRALMEPGRKNLA
jgi:hypothetical protein